MDLLHLKYFQIVAKNEHMTNAAKQLNIVQPALSRTINTLEKELGIDLFDRNKNSIKLNSNGKIFLKTVNETLSTLERGTKHLLDVNNRLDKEIKLLVLDGPTTLPNLILNFKKIYPEVTFKLLHHTSDNFIYNDFDFCISSTLDNVKNPTSINLFEEELFIGVAPNHPLSVKDSIFLKEVSNEPFISFEPGKPFRQISDFLCNYAGFKPKIVFESDIPHIIKQLVTSGIGISFIPKISWSIDNDDSIKLLKVLDPYCKRYLNISWNTENYMSTYALLFRDFTISYYSIL